MESTDRVPKETVEFVDTSSSLYSNDRSSNPAKNQGEREEGTLPKNGQTRDTLLGVNRIFQAGLTSGSKELNATKELVPLFVDEPTDYAENPQIKNMDRLYSTQVPGLTCTLNQVWVYQPLYTAEGTIDPNDLYVNEDGSLKDPDTAIPKEAFSVYRVPTDSDPGTGNTADEGQDADAGVARKPALIRFTNNRSNPHLTIPTDDYQTAISDLTSDTGKKYLIAGSGSNTGLKIVRCDRKNTDLDSYEYAYTILIRKGTIVRFVFDSTDGTISQPANFYDYNIGDGKVYKTKSDAQNHANALESSYAKTNYAEKLWMNTNRQGINDERNYSGDGTLLAFGNKPSDTGLETQTWNGSNTPNRSNLKTYEYGTFGLVSGFQGSGMPDVTWSGGIANVSWFGSGSAVGKTIYPAAAENFALTFKRQGNTYTLDGVTKNGSPVSTAANLSGFKNTANSIMSNEFWPMDSEGSVNGHDYLFGSSGNSANRSFVGASGTEKPAPISDGTYGGTTVLGTQPGPEHDHNSFFGLSYQITFTLMPGYCAPLEYWFYGDDDLWVFLDRPGDDSYQTQLVADIGGVHSSIGEYVDLWNYIDPVPLEAKDSQTYRLTVFYTERGASGSTCYMRFSVPMEAAQVQAEPRDEEIVVEKRLLNEVSELIDPEEPSLDENRVIFEGYKPNEWPEDMDTIETDIESGKLKMSEGFFLFKISLHNSSGTPYHDIYDYAIYDKSRTPDHTKDTDHSDCIVWGTIGDRSTVDGAYYFALKSDEYIVISNLPDGTWYEVKEISCYDYVTGWQKGTHVHTGGEQIDTLDQLAIYKPDTAGSGSFDAKVTNYVRFTNSPALKTVADPKDESTVLPGDTMEFNIYRENAHGDADTVLIRDRLDPGVDFIGAKFGENTSGKSWWEPSAEEWEQIKAGEAAEHTETIADGVAETIVYDPLYSYKAEDYPADDPDMQSALAGIYGEPGPTVLWTRTGKISEADAVASLKVRVNEDAGQTEEGAPDIENQAVVQVGNQSFVVTNKTETPSWSPEKTETKIDHTANAEHFDASTEEPPAAEEQEDLYLYPFVMPGDVIRYRVTWKNYTTETAKVTVRDILDANLSYKNGTAKAFEYQGDAAVEIGDGTLQEGVLVWELADRIPEANGYVEYEAEVLPGANKVGYVDNTASVQVGEQQEAETKTTRNETPEDPHKEVVSPANGAGVQVGDVIEYKITYRNYEKEAAKVTVTDVLDPGLEPVMDSLGEGSYESASRTITWTFDSVPAGESGEILFKATVTEEARTAGSIENEADMVLGTYPDQKTENTAVPVEEPHKEASPAPGAPVSPGEQIVYTITAQNNREEPTDLTIRDRLDFRLDFVSASDGGTFDAASRDVTWHLTQVPSGEERKVTLTVSVGRTALTEVANMAYVRYGTSPEVATENLVHPLSGGLSVTKEVGGTDGDPMKDWHFTVTLTGEGSEEVSGVYGEMTFTNADGIVQAKFTLKHGETKTAMGLPPGISYEVAEEEADSDGYVTVSENETGTIPETDTANVTFTNSKSSAMFAPSISKHVLDAQGVLKEDYDFSRNAFFFTIARSAGYEDEPLPEPETVATDETGKAVWNEVTLESGKTYSWTIMEQQGDHEFLEYDLTAHTLTVIVDGEGNVTAQWDGETKDPAVENRMLPRNAVLPSTGGTGWLPVVLPNAGLILTGFAALVWGKRKRKK